MTAEPPSQQVRAAARRDALALVTAVEAAIPGVPLEVVVDWLDRDLRPSARTVVLAEQLVYWSALLFTLTCRDRGLDPATTPLAMASPAGTSAADLALRRDALTAVAARLSLDAPAEAAVYARHLHPAEARDRVATFLVLLARVAAKLAAAAGGVRDQSASDLLGALGVTTAAGELGLS